MSFDIDDIDFSGISPSSLANSGLLMAVLIVDGNEVISVNMVVNVDEDQGNFYREIFNPLE